MVFFKGFFTRYGKLTNLELRAFLISLLACAFIFSFSDMLRLEYSGALRSFIMAMIIAAIAIGVQLLAHRYFCMVAGFKPEYRIWWYGILIGVILAFVSRGKLYILIPGGLVAYHLTGMRLGQFRYGLNYWPLGLTAIMGSVSNIVLAIIIKILLVFVSSVFLEKLLVFTLWYAVLTALPIPPLNGSHLFFASRKTYSFAFGFVIGVALSLYYLGILWSLLIAIIAGVITWLLYLKYIEPPTR